MKPVRRTKKSKIKSNNDRLRLSVYRSNGQIYAQIIDDSEGVTVVSASSLSLDKGYNKDAATAVGKLIAEKAKKQGVATKLIFDRGNKLYHGRIKALADAARENGLEF